MSCCVLSVVISGRDALALLPAERRDAELREMRLHLQMMAEDYVANGKTTDEAVVAALRQFGSAHTVGQGLQRVRSWDSWHRWRPVLAGL